MDRRSLITGLISFVAAPAIVRATSLMPVKTFDADELSEIVGHIAANAGIMQPVQKMVHLPLEAIKLL